MDFDSLDVCAALLDGLIAIKLSVNIAGMLYGVYLLDAYAPKLTHGVQGKLDSCRKSES